MEVSPDDDDRVITIHEDPRLIEHDARANLERLAKSVLGVRLASHVDTATAAPVADTHPNEEGDPVAVDGNGWIE
jgi:hypothetical protein